MSVKGGGSYTATANDLGLIVGWNSPGALDVDGGEVTLRNLTFSIEAAANGSTVNITNGGVLAVSQVKVYQGRANTATLNIDGGTVRACPYNGNTVLIADHAGLTVNVGANGATFDADSNDITIPKSLAGEGGVKFAGGGTVTLTGSNACTGWTTVEVGTQLVVNTPEDLGGGLAVSLPESPSDGEYLLVTAASGAFDESVVAGAVKARGVRRLRLADGGTKIYCSYIGNPVGTVLIFR